MMSITNNSYYIKPIEYDSNTNNRYFNVEGLTGKLLTQENKWYFDLDFYLVMNANLPIDLFTINLYNEIFEIKNVTLNKVNNPTLPDWITDPKETSTYHASFYVDMTASKINEQKLNNLEIDLNFNYEINYDVLNNNSINATNLVIDQFINECHNTKTACPFEYTNFQLCENDSDIVEFIENYWLDSFNGYYVQSKNLKYFLKNYVDINDPIKSLVSLDQYDEMKIEGYDLKFSYWNSKQKINETFEVQKYLDQYLYKPIEINFDDHTYFDVNNYKIQLSDDIEGISGFYLPFQTSGNYELAVKLKNNSSYLNVLFKNNFNFKNQEIFDHNILINSILINDLQGYQLQVC